MDKKNCIPPSKAEKTISDSLNRNRLTVAVGNCEVHYHGRAASKISRGDRLLIIKPDGTFLVHQGTKMAAINYQGPGSKVRCEVDKDCLKVISERKRPLDEKIEVLFFRIDFVQSFEIHDDESITVLGTERELSDRLMEDLNSIEPGLRQLKQESGLAKGIIDIMAEDQQGNLVVVELKRRTASLAAASQLIRYVAEVSKRKGRKVRGMLVSPEISPNAKSYLEKEGLEWHRLEYSVTDKAEIKGIEKKQKSLSEY